MRSIVSRKKKEQHKQNSVALTLGLVGWFWVTDIYSLQTVGRISAQDCSTEPLNNFMGSWLIDGFPGSHQIWTRSLLSSSSPDARSQKNRTPELVLGCTRIHTRVPFYRFCGCILYVLNVPRSHILSIKVEVEIKYTYVQMCSMMI